jgi:hypothetical protein
MKIKQLKFNHIIKNKSRIRIQIHPKTVLQYLHTALTAVAYIHINKNKQ